MYTWLTDSSRLRFWSSSQAVSYTHLDVYKRQQEGNTLPVSAFKDYVDGSTPSGTAAYEKRGIAVRCV